MWLYDCLERPDDPMNTTTVNERSYMLDTIPDEDALELETKGSNPIKKRIEAPAPE